MPLSRPVLVALVGAILVGAAFFATQGARQEAVERTPAPKANADESPASRAAKPEKDVAKRKAARQERSGSTPAAAKPATGLPAPVAAAVRDGRTTVMFFRQGNAADDTATARAVASQRGRKGVAVFSADIKNLNRYRALVGGLGLSQAPAVVILGKKGEARLIEGFIDPQTLAQEVADAR